MISESIGNIKDGYLGVYENVVGKYIEFYQEFSDILSKMAGWISSNDKGDKVTLSVGELYDALKTLKAKYENTVLFPTSGTTTEAEAKNGPRSWVYRKAVCKKATAMWWSSTPVRCRK